MLLSSCRFSIWVLIPWIAVASIAGLLAQGSEDPPPPPFPPLTFGYNQILCRAGSDTLVSPALHREPIYRGRITAVSELSLELDSPPDWEPGQLAGSHYVLYHSGPLTGAFHAVDNDQDGRIIVDTNGEELTAAPGDALSVIPYWTLATLFPEDNACIHRSTGMSLLQRRTRLMLPDLNGPGINLPPSRIFFQNEEGWFEETAGNAPAGNTPLPPDLFLWIRHRERDGDTTFLISGYVQCGPFRLQLDAPAGTKQDNALALFRPVDVRLRDLGLLTDPSVFTPSNGTSLIQRRDLILVFDNDATGINKAPAGIFYYDSAAMVWRDAANGNAEAGDAVIPAGTGLIIRRSSPDGATRFWVHPCPY